jgi:hypothetical protein
MTEDEYRNNPEYLHYSDLCLIARSYQYYEYIKSIPPELIPDSDAMKFGRAYDTYILEPEKFTNEWFIVEESARPEPEKTMASKANQAWKTTIEAEYPGKFISEKEHKVLKSMQWQLMHHPTAKLFITPDGKPQNIERFDLSGHKFTGKYDIFYEQKQLIVDLKTIVTVNPKYVLNHILKYRYYLQEYIYRAGAFKNYGFNPNFLFIFQEKAAPHDVLVLSLSNDWQIKAEWELKRLLAIYDKHQKEPELFKGIEPNIYEMELPSYLAGHEVIEDEEPEEIEYF